MIDVEKMVCHNEDTSILYHHGASRISKKAFQQAKMIITDNHEGKMEILPMSSRRCEAQPKKSSIYAGLKGMGWSFDHYFDHQKQ